MFPWDEYDITTCSSYYGDEVLSDVCTNLIFM